MRENRRLLTLVLMIGLGVGTFMASTYAWGMSPLRSQKTMNTIKKNCPDYYQTRDGRCLGNTFRSYFLYRSLTGGGIGSGK